MHTFTAMAGGSAVNYFNGQYLIYGLSVHWQDSSADLSGHTSLTYLFFLGISKPSSLFSVFLLSLHLIYGFVEVPFMKSRDSPSLTKSHTYA